jgi:hypothetical protein
MSKKLSAVHPGEVLREEFLVPMKLSPNAVARVVGVPRTRIERPVNGYAAAIGVLMRFVFRQYYASPLYGAATASVVDVARSTQFRQADELIVVCPGT